MSDPAPVCRSERRRGRLRDLNAASPTPRAFGLDSVEVGADQRTLTVHFLGKAPRAKGPSGPQQYDLTADNVRVVGGRRVRDLTVGNFRMVHAPEPDRDDSLVFTVDRTGDFSTYAVEMIASPLHPDRPPPGFDPRYSRVEFSFKLDCPSDLDCRATAPCPPEVRTEPAINYLAKDYESLRQVIFDRLALVMPQWQETNPADLLVALVELLAYTGDYLSYYQDAVATEAYLGTARQRISVRRHARLVDYAMHEGCNARAWVCVNVSEDVRLHARDVQFLTGLNASPTPGGSTLTPDELSDVPPGACEIFLPVTPSAEVQPLAFTARDLLDASGLASALRSNAPLPSYLRELFPPLRPDFAGGLRGRPRPGRAGAGHPRRTQRGGVPPAGALPGGPLSGHSADRGDAPAGGPQPPGPTGESAQPLAARRRLPRLPPQPARPVLLQGEQRHPVLHLGGAGVLHPRRGDVGDAGGGGCA
jgi:hypothetical protein